MKLAGFLISSMIALSALAAPAAEKGPPEAQNMRLAGAEDLQGRSAYQPVIQQQGGRWIAYIGHHGGSALNPLTGKAEANGTSIVDVTDPAKPRYLYHIPGSAEGSGEAGGAQMARVCGGLPGSDRAKFFLLRTLGNQGQEVWEVTDPIHPAFVSTVLSNLTSTHKNWWECDTGIAYLVAYKKEDGWKSRGVKIFDLSNPAKPRFVRDYGLVGAEPGAKGEAPQPLHGPIRLGNRVYFGYGTAGRGTLQIVDRDKLIKGDPNARDPFAPTAENILYAQLGRLDLYPPTGAHTAFPLLGMDIPDFAHSGKGQRADFVAIVNESTQNECREYRQMVFFVDITKESRPFSVSNFPVPAARGGGWFRARAAAASARIRATSLSRRFIINGFSSSPTSTPVCAPSMSGILIARRRSDITSRRSPTRPTTAGARPRAAAKPVKWRFKPTTSRSTTEATSTSSTAPIPACIFSSLRATRGSWRIFRNEW